MTPFDAYVMYLACKAHFTRDNYDYFKYNGKIRANSTSFDTRKDKYFFYKLSKKQDLLNFYVSNMVEKPDVWAGDLLNDKSQNIYNEWKARQQSLSYRFKLEVQDLYPDFDDFVKVEDGQHPKLYKLYRQGLLSIDTLAILDSIYNIFEYWNREVSDPIIWPRDCAVIMKYKPFIHYDIKKFKSVLKKVIVSAS